MGAVKLLFGDLASEILQFYRPEEDNRDNLVKIEQDAIFNCGNKRLLKEPKMVESYMYVFHQKSPKSYAHWSKDYQWGSCEGNLFTNLKILWLTFKITLATALILDIFSISTTTIRLSRKRIRRSYRIILLGKSCKFEKRLSKA